MELKMLISMRTVLLSALLGLLIGCATNPSVSTGNNLSLSDLAIVDNGKAKLVLYRNWHFVNGGVPSAFYINDEMVCEFRSGLCSLELTPGEYNISFALPSSTIKEGIKPSESTSSFVSHIKAVLKPNTLYSIYSDGKGSRTSGLVTGLSNDALGTEVYTPNATAFVPLLSYGLVLERQLKKEKQDEINRIEAERLAKLKELEAQKKAEEQKRERQRIEQEKRLKAEQAAKLQKEKEEAERLRLAKIEASKTPEQRALEKALVEWKSDRASLQKSLDAEYKSLRREWSKRCQDVLDDFFQADLGPGEHMCTACDRCDDSKSSALERLTEQNERRMAQWTRANPMPTLESVAMSANAKATSASPSNHPSSLRITKMYYKDAYADTTISVPAEFFGKYVFTKEDTPGFDQTYIFNKDGTGSYKSNPEGYYKTRKITQWGVLVENNEIFKKNVTYRYYEQRTASAMIIVFLLEDGEAGTNLFFINDGHPSVFGPYGAVIHKVEQ